MNKLVSSSGLALAGLVALPQYAVASQHAAVDTSRWWSVSAAVRGFYDDNPLATTSELREGSWGVEVRPSIDARWVGEQTTITGSYLYSMKYFFDREDEDIDQMHLIDLVLRHEFSENSSVKVANSFVYAIDPQVGDASTTGVTRSEGDYFRNLADVNYDQTITRTFGVTGAYKNVWYDYDQSGAGSYSALLDRTEHYPRLDTRWVLTPTLTGIVGYTYGMTRFNSDDALVPGFQATNENHPEYRDSDAHFIYVGADAIVNPQASLSFRGGVAYTDYINQGDSVLIDSADDSDWTPYGELSFIYNYLPESFVQVGVRYAKNRTDLAYDYTDLAAGPTLDQDTITGFLALSHKIMDRLTGSLTAEVQNGEFNGGAYDGEADGFYTAGIGFMYELTQYLGLEAGYNFDRLDSDIGGRSYTRNRLYFGVRGTY
ncbi:MAG: outer membrane beta-barrel protein [Limisphaerales bacterium]